MTMTRTIPNACECGGDGVKLDDVMAGETECEGCDTWVCKECGQDV